MDPYRTLGVNPQADLQTIRAAYFELMRRHHPDRAGGVASAADPQRARDINLAFDLLKDPMRRAAYDRTRAARRSAAPAAAASSRRPLSFRPPSGPSLTERSRRLRRVRRFQTALFIGGCLLLAGGATGLAWVLGPRQTFSAAAPPPVADRIAAPDAEAAPGSESGSGPGAPLQTVGFQPAGEAPTRR